ncbi:YheV family putative zinc ribbon protein [Marinobacterium jannaschii]|uniref:YheV family putative zinc ribbon protein n=1 Tax=Marinobacterium jannaschii TaxID=64970 RepID=UPI00047F3DAD|nr:YheV family putative zinc ribbon protein [Marinobacterium jannaschii]
MSVIKRFIAGAVCPRCAELDTLRMYRDEEREHRECVRCDFTDSMRLDGEPDPRELETRVNKAPKSEPVQAQPIKFFPNPSSKKH